MRKKSHISLAKFIAENSEIQALETHRKAFCLGSILPDCKPSFLTTKHEFHETFDMVQDKMKELVTEGGRYDRMGRTYCRDLGQVIHYLADYFTFPHNITYDGSLKDHCAYEEDLKHRLREYLKGGEANDEHRELQHFGTLDALIEFIQKMHAEYLKKKRCIEDDIRYIVALCRQVAENVIYLMELEGRKAFRIAFA